MCPLRLRRRTLFTGEKPSEEEQVHTCSCLTSVIRITIFVLEPAHRHCPCQLASVLETWCLSAVFLETFRRPLCSLRLWGEGFRCSLLDWLHYPRSVVHGKSIVLQQQHVYLLVSLLINLTSKDGVLISMGFLVLQGHRLRSAVSRQHPATHSQRTGDCSTGSVASSGSQFS